ncbi:MAG: DUF4286 family protein [Bacteroidia bacterium]|nr:DUF4286 family protein [Bacteroidia bacterium]
MIIYSVSVSIDKKIADEWKSWMLSKHIPDVMATGCFEGYQMSKMLEPTVDDEADTYNIQYKCVSMEILDKYRNEFSPALQAEHSEKYKGRFAAFRSILEVAGL